MGWIHLVIIFSRKGLPWWLRWYRICLQHRDPGLIPGLGRRPGEGNGNPLQYSDLENSMEVHGVAKSQTQLKDFHLKRVKKESKNAGLKLNIQKTKIMASGPIT